MWEGWEPALSSPSFPPWLSPFESLTLETLHFKNQAPHLPLQIVVGHSWPSTFTLFNKSLYKLNCLTTPSKLSNPSILFFSILLSLRSLKMFLLNKFIPVKLQWFLTWVVLFPRGCLAICGDLFGCHCWEGATGFQWTEAVPGLWQAWEVPRAPNLRRHLLTLRVIHTQD